VVRVMERLAGRLSRLSIAVGALIVATLACYTPRQIQAERRAISQFALLEESFYVPGDAILLAESYSSALHNEYASAGVVRIYASSCSCKEIVAEYRDAMTDSGWTATPTGNCDGVIWLNMRSAVGAQLGIEAKPPEGSQLADKWRLLQEQYEGLYYMSASLAVWYRQP